MTKMQSISHASHSPDPKMVLSKAALRTADTMGLSQDELGKIIGKSRPTLNRGIDPNSKSGELAALFIRLYRSLAVLVGDDTAAVRHWFTTHNKHLDATPRDQVMTIAGLISVVQYLDAMRGKI